MLRANAPTYRVQIFLIQCALNGYIRCYISTEFQRGLGWSRPLHSLKSKYCLMVLLGLTCYISLIQIDTQDIYTYKSNLYDFTYYDDDDDTKADTMMGVVDEVDSDDD